MAATKKKATKKKATKKKATKKRATKKSYNATIEAEWEKLMAQHAANPTKNYAMDACFKLGEKVRHPKFGDGIVGKIIYPNKIEVIFKTDLKILIHTGSQGQDFRI